MKTSRPVSPDDPMPVIASPCTGVCHLDGGTGLCLGCARSGDEIAGWRDTPAAERQRIWRDLPGRRARLGAQAAGPGILDQTAGR